jgi:hypothetical protein
MKKTTHIQDEHPGCKTREFLREPTLDLGCSASEAQIWKTNIQLIKNRFFGRLKKVNQQKFWHPCCFSSVQLLIHILEQRYSGVMENNNLITLG